MKKTFQKKRQLATRSLGCGADKMLERLQAQYLAAGVTPHELAEIEREASDPMKSALLIALLIARLEEGRPPGADVSA